MQRNVAKRCGIPFSFVLFFRFSLRIGRFGGKSMEECLKMYEGCKGNKKVTRLIVLLCCCILLGIGVTDVRNIESRQELTAKSVKETVMTQEVKPEMIEVVVPKAIEPNAEVGMYLEESVLVQKEIQPMISDFTTEKVVSQDTVDKIVEVEKEPIVQEIESTVVEEEVKDTVVGEEIVSPFLIDEAGMVYGVNMDLLDLSSGALLLPEDCIGIRRNAFANLGDYVYELYIPAGISQIEEGALNGLNQLLYIDVEPGNTNYISVEGVLYDASLTVLIAFPSGRIGGFVVPENVSRIAQDAFYLSSLSVLDIRACRDIDMTGWDENSSIILKVE